MATSSTAAARKDGYPVPAGGEHDASSRRRRRPSAPGAPGKGAMESDAPSDDDESAGQRGGDMMMDDGSKL